MLLRPPNPPASSFQRSATRLLPPCSPPALPSAVGQPSGCSLGSASRSLSSERTVWRRNGTCIARNPQPHPLFLRPSTHTHTHGRASSGCASVGYSVGIPGWSMDISRPDAAVGLPGSSVAVWNMKREGDNTCTATTFAHAAGGWRQWAVPPSPSPHLLLLTRRHAPGLIRHTHKPHVADPCPLPLPLSRLVTLDLFVAPNSRQGGDPAAGHGARGRPAQGPVHPRSSFLLPSWCSENAVYPDPPRPPRGDSRRDDMCSHPAP